MLEGGDRAVQGGGNVAGEQMVAVANHLTAGDHDRGDVGGGGGEHQVVEAESKAGCRPGGPSAGRQ